MPQLEPLGTYGSALPAQREAQQLFEGLVAVNPDLAQRAFDNYTAGTVPADMPTATAYRVMAHLFETKADEFIIFGDAVDEATEAIKREWWIANHASRTSVVDDEITRTAWRRARVGTYLTMASENAAAQPTPRNVTPITRGRSPGRAVA